MNAATTQRIDRRRRRPALACVTCRKSKIRCDRQVPCGNCSKSKNKTCVFDDNVRAPPLASVRLATAPVPVPAADPVSASRPTPSPRPVDEPQPASTTATEPSTASSTVSHEDTNSVSAVASTLASSSSVSSMHVDGLKQRVAELERRLALADKVNPRGAWAAHVPMPKQTQDCTPTAISRLHSMPRAIMSKTRLFGQSHWANAVLLYKFILDTFHANVMKSINPQVMQLLSKCKSLGQRIKAARYPAICSAAPPNNLPPRHVADQLVDNYFRISESVHRVVHIPSFRARYEEVYTTPNAADHSFMVQLHLVMAIGTSVFDADFSMRTTAISWLVQAQLWLVTAPSFKKRLTLTDVQSMVLLCIARELVGVDADASWISLGSVLRTAMQMGFHRDPCRLPPMDALQAELRRRLWGTIIELSLQASLNSGCPIMLSLSDFDTEPPADINDVDLSSTTTPSSLPKEAGTFTDMTLCLALRTTLPARLAICRYLNDLGAVSVYERTMELHEDLAAAHRSTSRKLANAERASEQKPTLYQKQVFDCTIRRYFVSLHVPHQEMALEEPAYAFSRATMFDNAIKIHAAYCPVDVYPFIESNEPWIPDREPATDRDTDLSRLAATGSGSYRWIPVCTALLIGLEIQHQLQNEMLFSPTSPRPDGLSALRVGRAWSQRRIMCGDMNIKGYVFMAAQWVMVDALLKGQQLQDISELLLQSANLAVQTGLEILEEQAQKLPQQQENIDMPWEPLGMSGSRLMPASMDEDWERMGGYFLDFLGLEPINHIPDATVLLAGHPWTEPSYGFQG